jgi:DNA-binding transcriptional regulator YbjK
MTHPADKTRDAIIKTAVRLFAEKGFEGTSVRDIVVKARVNQAAINYHFKGKDGLYLRSSKPRSRSWRNMRDSIRRGSRRFPARRLCKVSCTSNYGRCYSATR